MDYIKNEKSTKKESIDMAKKLKYFYDQQMKEDERRHAETANRSGAADLPTPIKSLMRGASRVMTGAAYWI